jgi:hypothetical protein
MIPPGDRGMRARGWDFESVKNKANDKIGRMAPIGPDMRSFREWGYGRYGVGIRKRVKQSQSQDAKDSKSRRAGKRAGFEGRCWAW